MTTPPAAAQPRRIVLWDIDGTLVQSIVPGLFRRFMVPAVGEVFGTSGSLDQFNIAGATDRQALVECLAAEGFDHDQVARRLPAVAATYLRSLEKAITSERLFEPLPGAAAAVAAVQQLPHVRSTLLTGNFRSVARFKLAQVGIDGLFELPGAFGEDSHDRRELPAIAAGRLEAQIGTRLAPGQFVIIGDTPNDIACARHFGARVIVVTTSRFHSADELAACRPDALLPDLRETDRLLDLIQRD